MSGTRLGFTVGPLTCRVVADGVASYETQDLYSSVPAEETGPPLRPLLNDEGMLPVPYHPLLVETPDGPALIDTGAGAVLAQEWGEPVGQLRDALVVAGVAPEDIRLVLISHAHPDHVGGLTVEDGPGRRLVFPNARHIISRTEFEFWTADPPPPDWADMAELARLHLVPVERGGMLELVDGEQEVAPGIAVIPAPGHTPGHVAFSLSASSQAAVFVADAVLGELNFTFPDWTSHLDVDQAEAARSRRRLLDEAARAQSTVVGYHLWEPGTVERHNGAYHWHPGG
ncbi:MAG TPA: MBL fold metallo-hydrolase [Streptosporangiaceae bacterium]|nr:MBL fold metallo-hydrolase [Streptosporangiaceae bacterium]